MQLSLCHCILDINTHERAGVTQVDVNCRENDTYDPRDPANITPASTEQIEEMNVAMLEQQIQCLQHAICHRENDDGGQILEHYKCVSFSLQSSLQVALCRKDQARICCDFEVDPPSRCFSKGAISEVPQQPATCFYQRAWSWFEQSLMMVNV